MSSIFSLDDLNTTIDNTPRIQDYLLGEKLGFSRPIKIREIIARNLEELGGFGSISQLRVMVNIGSGAQREVDEYWLNESQALLICMFSRTKNAAKVRHALVEVYLEWRAQPKSEDGDRQPERSASDESSTKVDIKTYTALLREARLVYGAMGADQLWKKLPVPGVDMNSADDKFTHTTGEYSPDEVDEAFNGDWCLRHLFNQAVSRTETVYEVFLKADNSVNARTTLSEAGIFINPADNQNCIAIAKNHKRLTRMFATTFWAQDWTLPLLRLDGAYLTQQAIPFSGGKYKAVIIPMEIVKEVIGLNAAEETPEDEKPIINHNIKDCLALVRVMQSVHGKKAAKDLWAHLPLPQPDADTVGGDVITAEGGMQDFINECVKSSLGSQVKAAVFYNTYLRWCSLKNIRPLTMTKFGTLCGRVFERTKGHVRQYLDICIDDKILIH